MRKSVLILAVLMFGSLVMAQKKLSAEQFIVKTLSEQKNPFAYIPFNRNLFLPTEEEEIQDEFRLNYPPNSRSIGHIVFLSSDDSTYNREPLVDAYGVPIQHYSGNRINKFSTRNDSQFFKRKQDYHLNRYPNMGRFLYRFSKRP